MKSMDKPQDQNIPSFEFSPPLGVKNPLQPLSPLGQAKLLSSLNEPLSQKQRRRRQNNTRSSDFSTLVNLENQNNFNPNIKPTNSESSWTNSPPKSLTSGQELLFTPSGFKTGSIEPKSVNNSLIQKTKNSIIHSKIEPQIPLNQSIFSSPQNQIDKPQPSSNSNHDVETIAKEVYRLLRQRVNIDRERRGGSSKLFFNQ